MCSLHRIFWYFPCLYPLLYVRYYLRHSIIPPFNTLQGRYFIRQTTSLLSQIALPHGRYVALAAMPRSLYPVSMRCSSVYCRQWFVSAAQNSWRKCLPSARDKRRVFQTLGSLHVCKCSEQTDIYCPLQHPLCM